MPKNILVLKHNKTHRSGVTLIELSISVAIIGLLLVMITGGSYLLHAAGIRRTITEFTIIRSSIMEFKAKYHFLPGDLPTASTYFGAYQAGTPPTGAQNGNGNSRIDGDEDLYSWRHLGISGLYPGQFTGVVADTGLRFLTGTNAPASEHYTNALFRFHAITNGLYATRGHAIQLGIPGTTGLPNTGVAKPKDAYAIDTKLDDGLATTGMFVGSDGTTPCINSQNAYALDSNDTGCNLVLWYEIF